MNNAQGSFQRIKVYRSLFVLTIILSIIGCSPENNPQQLEPTPSLELALGTTISAHKFTEISRPTRFPATPIPTELYPTWDSTDWTPSPSEIVASDSGNAFDFWLTSRFSVVLKTSDYPDEDFILHCVPDVVLGKISNVEHVPTDYYVIRYEGVGLGQCLIQNGQFEVTINIIDRP
jgi:hypothetical protein